MLIGTPYDDGTGNNSGATYVVRLESGGTVSLADAWSNPGESSFDWSGWSVAGPGDVNGDGDDDVLVGAARNSSRALSAGSAYLVLGPLERDTPNERGDVHLEHAEVRFRGEQEADQAGCAVAGAGDLNADGDKDIVIGACLSDRSRENGGAAFQFSEMILGERGVEDADGAMVGEQPNDRLGSSVDGAGDLDDDGNDDLIVGAPFADTSATDAGKAYISYGPAGDGFGTDNNMNEPEAEVFGESEGDLAGSSVAGIGDVNGDNFDDVAIGAPGRDANGEDSGAVYVLFGPLTGNIELSEADVILTGAAAFDFTGQSVAACWRYQQRWF